jgi:asparagine synthase (glutamine-hydrolysing)
LHLGEYISKTSENIVILNGDVSEEINNSYRYAEFAPTPEDFQEENIRLLKDVHRYDVLRSARCMV